jgi:hypothetical protein
VYFKMGFVFPFILYRALCYVGLSVLPYFVLTNKLDVNRLQRYTNFFIAEFCSELSFRILQIAVMQKLSPLHPQRVHRLSFEGYIIGI